MLRITTISHADATVLKLEGHFLDAWLEPLTAAYAAARNGRPVELDLAELRFVSPGGVTLLRRLISEGARVTAASNFISQLLQLETL
jgi:hypothetical protein